MLSFVSLRATFTFRLRLCSVGTRASISLGMTGCRGAGVLVSWRGFAVKGLGAPRMGASSDWLAVDGRL